MRFTLVLILAVTCLYSKESCIVYVFPGNEKNIDLFKTSCGKVKQLDDYEMEFRMVTDKSDRSAGYHIFLDASQVKAGNGYMSLSIYIERQSDKISINIGKTIPYNEHGFNDFVDSGIQIIIPVILTLVNNSK